jgi:hypothetical protein
VQLLDTIDAGRRPIRLLGVSTHNFCSDAVGLPDDWLPFA